MQGSKCDQTRTENNVKTSWATVKTFLFTVRLEGGGCLWRVLSREVTEVTF